MLWSDGDPRATAGPARRTAPEHRPDPLLPRRVTSAGESGGASHDGVCAGRALRFGTRRRQALKQLPGEECDEPARHSSAPPRTPQPPLVGERTFSWPPADRRSMVRFTRSRPRLLDECLDGTCQAWWPEARQGLHAPVPWFDPLDERVPLGPRFTSERRNPRVRSSSAPPLRPDVRMEPRVAGLLPWRGATCFRPALSAAAGRTARAS
jgi:hypothetical protein